MRLEAIAFVFLSIVAMWSCGGKAVTQSAPGGNKAPGPGESLSPVQRQIQDKIAGIVAKQLGVDTGSVDVNAPLSRQTPPADDLDTVEIIMTIEEEFNVEIKDEEVDAAVGVTNNLSVKKLAEIVYLKKKP